MNNSNYLIETSSEKLARIIGQKYNINVFFHANECCTNGKTIILPALSKEASEDLSQAIPGLLDHEVSHILFSNFEIIEKHMGNGRLSDLANALEDARVDTCMVQQYRGCRPNLEKCSDWCFKELIKEWDKIAYWGKAVQITGIIAYYPEDYWAYKEIRKKETILFDYIYKNFSEDIRTAVGLKSTEEIYELSKKILEKIHLKTEKNSLKLKQKISIKLTQESDDQLEESRKITSKKERIKKVSEKCHRRRDYLPYSTKNDVFEVVNIGLGNYTNEFKNFKKYSKKVINVILVRLQRNLISVKKSKWEGEKERGKLNKNKIHNILTNGSKKIFKRKIDHPKMNTRIAIWVDHSSSMLNKKLKIASECAYCLGECLHQLDVPFEIYGWSTATSPIEGTKIYRQASESERRIYTRWGHLWVGQYKSYQDSWNIRKKQVFGMKRNLKHNTYDGETLRIATQKILNYPEKRKIIFWLNDGQPYPNVPEFVEFHENYFKKVVKEVENYIEIIAFGIKTDSVKRYFKQYVVVKNLNELTGAALSQLEKILMVKKERHIRGIL